MIPGPFDIRFHEVLKRVVGDSEDGMLREKERSLGLGQFKDYPDAMHLVGYCQALRDVLERAEEIRKGMMEG